MASHQSCLCTGTISDESSSSTPEISSDDNSDCQLLEVPLAMSLPSMENITPYKRLDLPATCFPNGCICGHQFEYRDVFYDTRKRRNLRAPGITIRPQVAPVPVSLRTLL